MKKLLMVLLFCFLLTGCGSEGVSQEEYDKVVSQRDEYKGKYEKLLGEYSEMKVENTKKEIAEKIETTETEEKSANATVLYEDSNVKIYFSSITEKGVEFLVENLTDLNITIQADTVSINGISTNSIMMSDDVAPQSKGKVIAKCDDFSTNTVVETVGGQLRVVDFSETWNPYYYDAKFVNVPIE